MKKTHVLLLIFCMFLSIIGCSKENIPEQQNQNQTQTEQPSYDNAKISYLGPEGTYTQEACEKYFGGSGECIPYKTVDDAVTALVKKETDYAVIPQENTIGGAVNDYINTVIGEQALNVVGEVELPINQNLLTLPETELSDIKTVYSHKQGIAQGKDFLSENLPDAEIIEVSSTAEGAKTVAEKKDKSCAAIASAGCADVYGLKILSSNIQNNDLNKTRFYVLSVSEISKDKKERLAFIAKGNANSLPKLMSKIESEGVSLVAIHDSPQKTELGSYNYIIECADCSYESYEQIATTEGFEYRFLGCFDRY